MPPAENFDGILATLPEKRSRSRLEPYGELIHRMLARGRTYREVASILLERCQVHASISTIHDFVRRRAAVAGKAGRSTGRRRKTGCGPDQADKGIPASTTTSQEGEEAVQQRIAALKLRKAPAPTQSETFEYDPSEPLRVPSRAGSDFTG